MTAQRYFAALLLFLSNNNHAGDFAHFGVADFLADFFTSGVKFGADSCCEERLIYAFCIVMNIFGNREHHGLNGSEPKREVPGGVLDEDADKAFHGAKGCTVNNNGAVFLAVTACVGEVEPFRHHTVNLNGAELPLFFW